MSAHTKLLFIQQWHANSGFFGFKFLLNAGFLESLFRIAAHKCDA